MSLCTPALQLNCTIKNFSDNVWFPVVFNTHTQACRREAVATFGFLKGMFTQTFLFGWQLVAYS